MNVHPGWDRARCQECHLKVYVTFLKEVSFEKLSRLFLEVHPKNVEIIDWENVRKTVVNVVLRIKKKLNDISPRGKSSETSDTVTPPSGDQTHFRNINPNQNWRTLLIGILNLLLDGGRNWDCFEILVFDL